MQGTILAGRYVVGAGLGTGGMGAVYLATDLRTGGSVAVKIPHPWLTLDSEYTLRLHREAEIAASLTSPRVVRVIDFDWHEGRPFLVMEYVPGDTLSDILTAQGPLPWREAARIGLEVARALEAAHRGGIVHRDLKPQNIKIVEGDVKVLDFGIARADSMAAVTSTSVVVGTPEYIAPERLGGPGETGDARGDARSDIYALGIIMWEMIQGRTPFQADSHWAVMRAQISDPPGPLPASVPARLQAVIYRCLEKQPANRYPTAAALAADLRALGITGPFDHPSEPVASRPEAVARFASTGKVTHPHGGAAVAAGSAAAGAGAAASVLTPPTLRASQALTAARPADNAASGTATGVAVPAPAKRRAPVLIWAGGAVAALTLAGAGMMFARGGAGPSPSPTAAPVAAGVPAITTTVSPTPAPTPAPTAAPALISNVQSFRSGAEFEAGRAEADLPAGSDVVICYGYQGAGAGTELVTVATGPDGAANQVAATTPARPEQAEGVRCDPLPGAGGFTPGRYVALVQDRGQEQGRAEFTLTAPTPSPTPSPSPSPSPSPTGLASAKGFITVAKPLPNARLVSPVEISGTAMVFEATVLWRIVDSAGRVIAEGYTTASAGAPARGDYRVTATFTQPSADTYATVEVYDRSPRDGNVDEIVRVPVILPAK